MRTLAEPAEVNDQIKLLRPNAAWQGVSRSRIRSRDDLTVPHRLPKVEVANAMRIVNYACPDNFFWSGANSPCR
jgi:hypothetical protein